MKINNKLIANANYSTSETKIGTWIDNRPIYRKNYNVILSGSFNNKDSIIPNSLINNLADITKIRGVYKNTYGNFFPIESINPNGSLNQSVGLYYNAASGITLRMGTSSISSNSYANIIVEYTKTTD